MEMDDSVAWHYDKKGIFSVKFAYKVMWRIRKEDPQEGIRGHHQT
jgi:hypothetical protein